MQDESHGNAGGRAERMKCGRKRTSTTKISRFGKYTCARDIRMNFISPAIALRHEREGGRFFGRQGINCELIEAESTSGIASWRFRGRVSGKGSSRV